MTHRGPQTDAHDRLAAELAEDYLIEEEVGRGASATRTLLAALVSAAPGDPTLLARYGVALARAGRGDEAIRAGRRAVELLPPERDGQRALSVRVHLARIYVPLDQPAPALELLGPLTKVPSWISPDELRSDPTWAALRSHPLFPQLAH